MLGTLPTANAVLNLDKEARHWAGQFCKQCNGHLLPGIPLTGSQSNQPLSHPQAQQYFLYPKTAKPAVQQTCNLGVDLVRQPEHSASQASIHIAYLAETHSIRLTTEPNEESMVSTCQSSTPMVCGQCIGGRNDQANMGRRNEGNLQWQAAHDPWCYSSLQLVQISDYDRPPAATRHPRGPTELHQVHTMRHPCALPVQYVHRQHLLAPNRGHVQRAS